MKEKGRVFKILSYIFAATALVFFIAAVSVAMGGGSGFLDLSNFVAIIILCCAVAFSVLGAIMSLLYKTRRKGK